MPVSRRSVRIIGVAAGIATLVCSASTALADVPALQLQITYNGGPPIVLSPAGTGEGPMYNYSGTYIDILGAYRVTWSINANPDPLISSNLVIENLTGSEQTFGLMVTLPTTQALGPQLMGGSAAVGLTTNADGGSITSLLGTPIWAAMIDGTNVADLFPDEYEQAHTGTGSSSASSQFGLPIPSMAAPPVNASIGVDINLALTSLDQASITSVFVVTPAPGGLAVFGLALCGTRRRRRK